MHSGRFYLLKLSLECHELLMPLPLDIFTSPGYIWETGNYRIKRGIGMRKATVIVLMLALAGAVGAQSSIWFNGSLEAAQAKALAENKLILIDFSSHL